jgi:glucose-6-phosphate-specific signal transduction histidine kinase
MRQRFHYLFILFLVAYTCFTGFHVFSLHWGTQTFVLFGSGFFLALISHAKKNSITVAILILHMGIEWFEWSQEKINFRSTLFNAGHALMDFVFLSHELKVHVRNYHTKILLSTGILLFIIFLVGQSVTGTSKSIQDLEPFVLGGVLGCVLAHLYFHLKKE